MLRAQNESVLLRRKMSEGFCCQWQWRQNGLFIAFATISNGCAAGHEVCNLAGRLRKPLGVGACLPGPALRNYAVSRSRAFAKFPRMRPRARIHMGQC